MCSKFSRLWTLMSDFISVWKATEYRSLPLYLGLVILIHYLPLPLYLNYKRLAPAMYLLAHLTLRSSATDPVRNNLSYFLKEYEWCYGLENYVYIVHLLKHPTDDAHSHGASDSFSTITKQEALVYAEIHIFMV